MSPPDDIATANLPWDGRWYYPLRPKGLRFVSPSQHTATQLLRAHNGLTVADAKLLQAIITTEGKLSPTQSYWLDRLAREYGERIAA